MDEEGGSSDHQKFRKLAEKIKSALRSIWKEASHDVFDIGLAITILSQVNLALILYSSEEDATRVDRLAEELGTVQSLKNAFDPILNVILASLDVAAVFMRTKALRALGQIVTADPGILRHVRREFLIFTDLQTDGVLDQCAESY